MSDNRNGSCQAQSSAHNGEQTLVISSLSSLRLS